MITNSYRSGLAFLFSLLVLAGLSSCGSDSKEESKEQVEVITAPIKADFEQDRQKLGLLASDFIVGATYAQQRTTLPVFDKERQKEIYVEIQQILSDSLYQTSEKTAYIQVIGTSDKDNVVLDLKITWDPMQVVKDSTSKGYKVDDLLVRSINGKHNYKWLKGSGKFWDRIPVVYEK
jgi:hypothetical protein